ncbi:glycoside hydrolase family 2 TIM barrel-domain containing protein [Flavobacterium sp. NG2]|uniref:glycoside hydrolase family 2 protein n=1 Tax=Flavobacterium sp. NG2 TaxID=3097547 RepID=UPI002A808C17|nr:glycoside hydrolase family 2 TIM barrel-domain containing protein [Flavobacterium sp. NG2]WPR71165.1 glycoside hydrolase family 2 TIM barrel-domain containing protein [Flavobacterium sp. NG2]
MKKQHFNPLNSSLLYSIAIACFLFSLHGIHAQRTKTNINENWSYLENDTNKITTANQAKNWTVLNLPHTWNSEDATDNIPGYRRAASWYKKQLVIPAIAANTVYQLYFEGSNITTKVYVNGKEAGEHIGGYIGFTIDITSLIKQGNNEVAVRVDNSYNPEIIPSQKSDFTIYGGITRDVWLLALPKNHIDNLKITTPKVSNQSASLNVVATINNLEANKDLKLEVSLKNPKGKIVTTKKVIPNSVKTTITFDNIKNPELWDTQKPNLYTVTVSLLDKNKEKDQLTEKVGFRWFEFKDHGPFYLNGKRLLIRGTHRHEEHAGVGAAMTNKQHHADMEAIKEMGANFVRLAHYPQDPEIYKACDELGLLVWDELPWCRGGLGNDVWQTNSKNMLKEMIAQNFNHPSIILWSLGNEMNWLPDFPGGDDPEKTTAFLSELNDLAHQLDPSRKTAIRKYYEGSHIVDVFSPSIWSGWYSGSYKSYQKALDTYKKEYKHFIHAEYGGDSHVGRHTEKPVTGEGVIKSEGWEEAIVQTQVANIAQIGDWSENYIVDLFDWHLHVAENDPDFVGNIQWAFKDFATPLRPEDDIPYMNQKGLTDRNRNPKDAYYVFKSYWSEKPFAYIESHTWTDRQGPKDVARNINVYSNCNQVTLYHNGKSLGKKQRDSKAFPACGLNWDLNFEEGKNTLIAVGETKDGKTVSDTINVNYRFKKNDTALGLTLSAEKLKNGNYLVTALAVDKNNLRCLDYEERIYFQCLKGGTTLKNQGTPTGSESIKMANGKASIEVIPDADGSPIVMTVLNQNFKGEFLKIE